MSSCTQIKAHINDQVIQLSNLPKIASGSVGALEIACDFCSRWDGCGKVAVFYRTEDEVYHVPVVDDVVKVPHEVLSEEGVFYFGVMGQDNITRTTEVVSFEVAKGAITTATAQQEAPTPDIYRQLVAAYGLTEQAVAVERARIDELVAMRSSDGTTIYEFDTTNEEVAIRFDGSIRTSGAVAYIVLKVSGASGGYFAERDYYETDYIIPPWLAPMTSVNFVNIVGAEEPDLLLGIDLTNTNEEGWHKFTAQKRAGIDPPAMLWIEATYPLAALSIQEMSDIRVAYGGKTYPTAGEAVREQVMNLHERCGGIEGQVEELKKNVTGDSITIADDGKGNVAFTTVVAPDEPEFEPHTLSGVVVTVEDENAVGSPLEITASDGATKVFVGGKNFCPETDFVVSSGAKTIVLDVPLPAGSYVLSANTGGTVVNFRALSSSGEYITYSNSTMTIELKTIQMHDRSEYAEGRNGYAFYAKEPIGQLVFWAATFEEVCLVAETGDKSVDYSYAGAYRGKPYNLPVSDLTLADVPTVIFDDKQGTVTATYYTPAVLDDAVKGVTDINEVQSLTINGRSYNSFHDLRAQGEIDELRKLIEDSPAVELAEHRLSGSVVKVSNPSAVGNPLEITASDGATKVFVCGANLIRNEEVTFTRNASINLPFKLPAGQYTLKANVTGAEGKTYCLTQLKDTSDSAKYTSDIRLKPATGYVTFTAKYPFNKIDIFAGTDASDAAGVQGRITGATLAIGESATAEEYRGEVYELPITNNITLTAVPTVILDDNYGEVNVTYHTPAESASGLPPIDTGDEGKLLKVVGGVAAWVQDDGGGGADAGTSFDVFPNEYYFDDDYLPKKVAEINGLIQGASLNGDAFIFITDMHTERGAQNGGQAPALIKYICDNTKVRRVFTGGDLALTLAQHTAVGESLEKAIGVDIHSAMGNHEYDVVKQGDGDIVPRMTEADLYYVYDINKLNQVSENAARHYYYVDNPQQKVRYVVVNNWMHKSDATTSSDGVKAENIEGSVDEQATWLTDTAFNVEAGWGIILFCHQFFNGHNASTPAQTATAFMSAIDEFNAKSDNQEVIAVFHGHIHRDMVNYTQSGVPVIGVMADKTHTGLAVDNAWRYEVAYQQDTTPATGVDGQYWLDTATNPHSVKVYSSADGLWRLVPEEEVNLLIPRYKGTITEQAFDVVVVDRTARKIHCVRIGTPAVGGNGAFENARVETRTVDF